jgi:hypothetical protein
MARTGADITMHSTVLLYKVCYTFYTSNLTVAQTLNEFIEALLGYWPSLVVGR